MASILLLLEALIRCCHHEIVPQSPKWKEKETKDLTLIIKAKKQEKESRGLDNLDCFWSFFHDRNDDTKPWKLADSSIWL
ncbi:hypothetical protein VNO77_13878 [Canavalia gladiata]|uniref:Uncharacterized protein n=1 Tax=Canavalia gladiata TaxID=3824 RepID=A0AAN9QV69_CANGL